MLHFLYTKKIPLTDDFFNLTGLVGVHDLTSPVITILPSKATLHEIGQ
jgi:hypothetical protein